MTSGSIKAVLFDMDGTIVDVPYDWDRIKAELKTGGRPILSYLESLPEPEKSRKRRILERYEKEATRKAELKEGVKTLLAFLKDKGIACALVTNNSQFNTDFLLKKFSLSFDVVISRESGMWKPFPAPLHAAMKAMKVKPEDCCVVGDSLFDIMAAEEAGITKIFLVHSDPDRFPSGRAEIHQDLKKLSAAVFRYLRPG